MTTSAAIHAEAIDKSFGETRAVAGATVSVAPGELVAVLGPSGSGKTTLLRVISGFEVPDAGTVSIGSRVVVGEGVWVEPDRRRIGMVFQDGALFPHLSVAANVGFGNPRRGRVEECLELVGLADRARSYPHELSGGERQRVALARALATEPEVILLDEPFASLDAGLRVALREEVSAILRDAGASALLVTHDQQEALSLADVVVVMRGGKVEQADSPEEVYARPANRWVAEFLGAASVLPGRVVGGMVECELGRFRVDAALAGDVDVIVRPEWVAIGDPEAGEPEVAGAGEGRRVAVDAQVTGRSYYGHDQLVGLELRGGHHLQSRRSGAGTWRRGDRVRVWMDGPVSVLPRTAAGEGTDGAES